MEFQKQLAVKQLSLEPPRFESKRITSTSPYIRAGKICGVATRAYCECCGEFPTAIFMVLDGACQNLAATKFWCIQKPVGPIVRAVAHG